MTQTRSWALRPNCNCSGTPRRRSRRFADVLADEIVEYREECRKKGKDVSPDGFMFPGRFGGPMDPSNYRHRVLHKLAEELGFPKLNCRSSGAPLPLWARPRGIPRTSRA